MFPTDGMIASANCISRESITCFDTLECIWRILNLASSASCSKLQHCPWNPLLGTPEKNLLLLCLLGTWFWGTLPLGKFCQHCTRESWSPLSRPWPARLPKAHKCFPFSAYAIVMARHTLGRTLLPVVLKYSLRPLGHNYIVVKNTWTSRALVETIWGTGLALQRSSASSIVTLKIQLANCQHGTISQYMRYGPYGSNI